jgi:hypothetical protein
LTDIASYATLDKFSGIDNVSDPTRLPIANAGEGYKSVPVYSLQLASNLDIDNTFALSSRPGYASILSSATVHSIWSDNVYCLFVDGTILKQLRPDYSTVSLKSVTLNARMSYVSWNDRIYFTNGYEIGYVDKEIL